MKFYIFCSITFFYSVTAFSFVPSPVKAFDQDSTLSASLYQHAEIANVGNENFSFNEFLSRESALDFKPIKGPSTNLGFTKDKFWLRFVIQNTTAITLKYFLETGRPITDLADLYLVSSKGAISVFNNGDLIPFWEKSFQHRKIIFPITLEPQESYQVYIHYQSDGEVINLPLNLHTSTSLILSSYRNQLFHGLFYGILLLAGAVYLFFFFGIGEKSFLLYSAYVLSVGLLHMSLDGYFFQYINPSSGWLNQNAILITAALSAIAFGRYAQIYMGIKIFSKILNLSYNVLLGALFILLTGIVLVPDGKPVYYPAVNLLSILLLFLLIAAVVLSYRNSKKVDPFFTLAIFSFSVGFFILILNNFSLIPNSFFTENGSKIGTGLEMIFLSLAMSNRIRLLKSEKEKMQEVALRKSEESNEIKSYFLSNISHELRTPLNAIIGLTHNIKQSIQEEGVKSDVEVIQYSSLGLLGAIDDVLDFAKIEKKELLLEERPFDFQKIIQQISSSFEKQAQDKGLEFIYEESDPLPYYLIGDPKRTSQMIQNILKNAVKFTMEGSVLFKIQALKQTDNSITLAIGISDTGVGIKKEKLDSIFDSFIQGQNDDKRKFGGFGLGLCIVKALVDLQHGAIKISSEEGKGTEVRLELRYTLPVMEGLPDQVGFDHSGVYDLENKSILIVEDNAINQLVLKTILGKWDNTVFQVANNGLEALDLLKKVPIDLILMDLQMPLMDGYEATQAIRSGACGVEMSQIPIIAVTADVTEKAKKKVFAMGMDGYLTKPINTEELYHKVKMSLTLQKMKVPEIG